MKRTFGDFEFDEERRILRRGENPIALTGQALDLLKLMLDRPGEVISREEIQQVLWPDRNVEFDHSLDVLIHRLRSALGGKASGQQFIRTVRKRGYQFLLPAGRAPSSARFRLKMVLTYAFVAILGAIMMTLFLRTRYDKFVPRTKSVTGEQRGRH